MLFFKRAIKKIAAIIHIIAIRIAAAPVIRAIAIIAAPIIRAIPIRIIATFIISIRAIAAPIKWLFLLLIRVYQKTISPDHGIFKHFLRNFGFCKYEPTCSEYMYQAIEKYGVVRGVLKGAWRVLRCNPWSKGGIDVP